MRSETECPYCTSVVRIWSKPNGHLDVHHIEPFGPDCEQGLRRLIVEGADEQGSIAVFPRSN
jgi:hypothetical protein